MSRLRKRWEAREPTQGVSRESPLPLWESGLCIAVLRHRELVCILKRFRGGDSTIVSRDMSSRLARLYRIGNGNQRLLLPVGRVDGQAGDHRQDADEYDEHRGSRERLAEHPGRSVAVGLVLAPGA